MLHILADESVVRKPFGKWNTTDIGSGNKYFTTVRKQNLLVNFTYTVFLQVIRAGDSGSSINRTSNLQATSPEA